MGSNIDFTIGAFRIQKTVEDRVLIALPENSSYPNWTLWLNRKNMTPIKGKQVSFKVVVPDTFNFVIKNSYFDGSKWIVNEEKSISAISLAEQFSQGA